MRNRLTEKRCFQIEVIAIGASAGGLTVLQAILQHQCKSYPLPIILCVHIGEGSTQGLISLLQKSTDIPLQEAQDKEPILAGRLYIAPPAYHLLVEKEFIFGLSMEPPVNYARPAIDVLFESIADAYRASALGILLTGASRDGARGLCAIQSAGGLAIVQDPETAEHPTMPQAGLQATDTSYVLRPSEIQAALAQIARHKQAEAAKING